MVFSYVHVLKTNKQMLKKKKKPEDVHNWFHLDITGNIVDV